LTAAEALDAYGIETLREVAAEGSALLCASPDAAAYAIRAQRENLHLNKRAVAARANLAEHDIEKAEGNARDVRLRTYEKIAASLGIDERYVSVRREPAASQDLAVRLRVVGEAPRMTGTVVAALAEAAWVAATQVRLECILDLRSTQSRTGLQPSDIYGASDYPAYEHGYHLARQTREVLSKGESFIPSMRVVCEQLGIVVVQAELGEWVAGATVEVSPTVRAIVVNVGGQNQNVFIRRATLAHEIEHLLYDPAQQLNRLRVDQFDELERQPFEVPDRVEQRANAFAVEFLAPQLAAVELFKAEGLGSVINTFGVSFTVARYQVWNGMDRSIPLESLTAPRTRPADHWVGAEQYTADYHPLGSSVARCGRFSGVVVRAAQEQLISWDTAAEYLQTSASEAEASVGAMQELFPGVWGGSSG
jgi:Zn-dependent peptidase ImmA (M78 family)/transcriptional regulator with XRE-family HTH domain